MHNRCEGLLARIGSAIVILTFGFIIPLRLAGQGMYSITDLGTLGGLTSRGNGINDLGQATGDADNLPGGMFPTNHAFLYSDGVMSDLGVLSVYTPGAGPVSRSWGTSINNLGQVAGYSYTSSGFVHAFFYDQGTMTDLGTLNGVQTSKASSLNTNGQIVGTSLLPSGTHAFLYDVPTMTMSDLGTLGGTTAFAYGINNSGVIVGDSWTNSNGLSDVAYFYSNGIMNRLPNLGSWPAIEALAINDNGQITGYAGQVNSGPYVDRGFLYSGGTMTDLGNLGGQITNVTPSSINNKGQIVGVVGGYSGPYYGFIYSGGVMTDLNALIDPNSGWTIIRAPGINNSGQIIAIGENSLGRQHALLLTWHPVLKNMHISGGHAQFMLSGTTGATYRVDYALSPLATNWITLTNVALSSSPTQLVDQSSAAVGQRYYRAVQE